jgi:hypothetical protein
MQLNCAPNDVKIFNTTPILLDDYAFKIASEFTTKVSVFVHFGLMLYLRDLIPRIMPF